MKKHILILILALTISSESFCQDNQFTPVSSFGIRQGANASFVDFSPIVKEGLLYGYNGGLVYRYVNETLFALQIELNFTQKGWIEDLDTVSNSYTRKLNYIELPFMTQIYLGKKETKYYLNLGTAVAYLISEKETMEIGNDLFVREYYNKSINSKFDYSVVAELGLIYNSKLGPFQFGIRYYYTISNLFKYSSDAIYDLSRNQVINVSLSYYIFSK